MTGLLQKRETLAALLREELMKSYQEFNVSDEQKQVNFKRKQAIFHEGNACEGIYLLLSGLVKNSMKGSNNKNLLLSLSEKSEFLGYTCPLMNLGEYVSTAIALTDVQTLFISRSIFEHLLKKNADLKKSFLELLGIDSQNINRKMLDLAYKPVRGRLADALLSLDKEGANCESDAHISLTRNELANYIGSVRETTTRLLSEFKKEQLIEMSRESIHVVNYDKLNFISKLYK